MDLVLDSEWAQQDFTPDLILQLGRPPTSSAWLRWHAAHTEIPHIVLSAQGYPDVESSADWFIQADLRHVTGAVLKEMRGASGDERSPWVMTLSRVGAAAREVVAGNLNLSDDAALGELEAAALVVESLPDSANLVVGNSLTIRHVDLLTVGTEKKLAVYSQRGANGIDGLVSGAAGVASCSESPTVLLLGDVSMLHDIGGLALANEVSRPLCIVILNNGGGRIFERLPVASRPDLADAMPSFTTPHGYDFAGAAQLYQLPFHRATTPGELREALKSARDGGTHLVEAVVGAKSAGERLDKMAAEFHAALKVD